jgi:hypothetical protein
MYPLASLQFVCLLIYLHVQVCNLLTRMPRHLDRATWRDRPCRQAWQEGGAGQDGSSRIDWSSRSQGRCRRRRAGWPPGRAGSQGRLCDWPCRAPGCSRNRHHGPCWSSGESHLRKPDESLLGAREFCDLRTLRKPRTLNPEPIASGTPRARGAEGRCRKRWACGATRADGLAWGGCSWDTGTQGQPWTRGKDWPAWAKGGCWACGQDGGDGGDGAHGTAGEKSSNPAHPLPDPHS